MFTPYALALLCFAAFIQLAYDRGCIMKALRFILPASIFNPAPRLPKKDK